MLTEEGKRALASFRETVATFERGLKIYEPIIAGLDEEEYHSQNEMITYVEHLTLYTVPGLRAVIRMMESLDAKPELIHGPIFEVTRSVDAPTRKQ